MRANLVLFSSSSELISQYDHLLTSRGFEVFSTTELNDVIGFLKLKRIDGVIALHDHGSEQTRAAVEKIREMDQSSPVVCIMEDLDKDLALSLINKNEVFFVEGGKKGMDLCVERIDSSMARKKRLMHPAASDLKLFNVIQDVVDWTWKIDPEGRFVYSRVSGNVPLGYDNEDLVSMGILDLVPSIDWETIMQKIESARSSMRSVKVDDLKIMSNSGRLLHFIMRATPLPMMDGSYAGLIGFCIDNTEKVEALEMASKAKEWNSLILESVPEAIVVLGIDGSVVALNRKAVELFGFVSEEDAIGSLAYDLIPDFEIDRIKVDIKSVLIGENLGPREYDVMRKDGTFFRAEVNSTAVLSDLAGRPELMVLIYRDVTERNRISNEIEMSRSRYKQIVENIPGFIFETDMDLCLTYISPSCRTYGFREEDLLSSALFELISDHDRFRIAKELEKKLDGKGFKNLTFKMMDGKGDEHVMLMSGSPFYGEGDIQIGYRGIVRDMTDNIRRLKEMDDGWNLRELTLENIGDLVWTSDLNGKITYLSPEFRRTCEIALGMSLDDASANIFKSVDRQRLRDTYDALIADGAMVDPSPRRSRSVEVEMKRRDGSTVWVDHRVSILKDSTGSPTGLMGIGRDITERKRSHQSAVRSFNFLKNVFWNAPETWLAFDASNRSLPVIDCNRAAINALGYSHEELVGMRLSEVVMGLDTERLFSLRERMLRGENVTIEGVHRKKDGSFIDVETTLVISGSDSRPIVFAASRDISGQKKEKELHKRVGAELIMFGRIIAVAESCQYPEELIERVMPLIRETMGFDVSSFFVLEGDEIEMAGHDGFEGDVPEEMFRFDPLIKHFIIGKIKVPEPEFNEDMSKDILGAKELGIESTCVIPFKVNEILHCALFLGNTKKRSFTQSDKEVLMSVWKLMKGSMELYDLRSRN